MTHLTYRPDIDGLRAVAVTAVLIFHAFPATLPGGFVGVDVFFVISGYLITGIILKGLRDEDFSFVRFYARRVRRIFPALAVVLAACLLAGYFLLLPTEFETLGQHVVTGSLFVSNIVLWSESSYFDAAAGQKVLLHLWSLGIEEQFYIVWPIGLYALWRVRIRPWIGIAAALLASFGACLWMVALTRQRRSMRHGHEHGSWRWVACSLPSLSDPFRAEPLRYFLPSVS